MPGVPLRDVCAVWREINLFGHWIPAVHTARVLRWFGPAEFLLWLDVWLGVLYRDVVAYGFVDALDARAASDDAPATVSLLCAFVELLPTAARRALGSAPHASVRHALYGLDNGRGARAAPHAYYGATLHHKSLLDIGSLLTGQRPS